ncbi:MAG: patatin-like phospholipase family protein [Cyclobacteriaceae bacterium]
MAKKVALVLSSGGARGVSHIGVIEGLLENGYEISSIAGSSMGAVIGAVYAAGKLEEFKEWIIRFPDLKTYSFRFVISVAIAEKGMGRSSILRFPMNPGIFTRPFAPPPLSRQ